jgi:hypothetical protein
VGTTISETLRVLSPPSARGHLGKAPVSKDEVTLEDKAKVYARIVISILLVFAGVYLCAHAQGQNQAVGGSLLGVVAGYWLK